MEVALPLAPNVIMPVIGYGTAALAAGEMSTCVAEALRAGFRLVDTAAAYGNEEAVGAGISRVGLPRDEVFVTSKFDREQHSRAGVRRAFEASVGRLGLDHLDLLLIHWPNPDQGRFVEAWEGLIDLHERGAVRAIGTSNFLPTHLQQLIDATGVVPHVNQIQLSPWTARHDERTFHDRHRILTQGWGPLALGWRSPDTGLLEHPAVTGPAAERGWTPAQVVLRWHRQHGVVPIVKTADRGRMRENLAIAGDGLTDTELARIDALDLGPGAIVDPEAFGH